MCHFAFCFLFTMFFTPLSSLPAFFEGTWTVPVILLWHIHSIFSVSLPIALLVVALHIVLHTHDSLVYWYYHLTSLGEIWKTYLYLHLESHHSVTIFTGEIYLRRLRRRQINLPTSLLIMLISFWWTKNPASIKFFREFPLSLS